MMNGCTRMKKSRVIVSTNNWTYWNIDKRFTNWWLIQPLQGWYPRRGSSREVSFTWRCSKMNVEKLLLFVSLWRKREKKGSEVKMLRRRCSEGDCRHFMSMHEHKNQTFLLVVDFMQNLSIPINKKIGIELRMKNEINQVRIEHGRVWGPASRFASCCFRLWCWLRVQSLPKYCNRRRLQVLWCLHIQKWNSKIIILWWNGVFIKTGFTTWILVDLATWEHEIIQVFFAKFP